MVLNAASWSKKKSDGLYNLVKDLKNRGCPIHGVGFQSHVTTNFFYDGLNNGAEGIKSNMRRYQNIGVETQITELDVVCDKHNNNCVNGGLTTSAGRQLQGKVFSHLLSLCLSEPNCKAFITWGFTDLISWQPKAKCLPFDDNVNPKPAYWSMLYELNSYQTHHAKSLMAVDNLVETDKLSEVNETVKPDEFFSLDAEADSLKYIY